jgi:hypothetical protein
LTHLEGLRSSLQPANYHEEEIVRNVALAYWQLRRVHLYEVAKARQQMDTESEYGSGGQAMGTLIKAGVESVEAQLAECHRVLELIGLERTAEAAFFLSGDDGRLLLRYAVVVVTKSKLCDESQAFTDLPTEGDPWTWETVRSRLHELAKAAGKPLDVIMGTLHKAVLERYDTLRETLEEGVRTIHSHYVLHNGQHDLMILYQARITNRIAKLLSVFGQSKADRLGLTMIEPALANGGNGDGAIE